MSFAIEVHGDTAIERRFDDIALRTEDARPALRAMREAWLESNRRTFALRGRGNWPPLAPSTQARKQGRPPLVGTGRMRRTLTQAPPIDELSRTRLRVGTNYYLARFHHEGRGVPKRALVQLDRLEFERDAIRALHRHVIGRGA
jgi:hypothetical protein